MATHDQGKAFYGGWVSVARLRALLEGPTESPDLRRASKSQLEADFEHNSKTVLVQ